MGPRSFAFMSFLDLISCAFGAAILIFLVAVSAERALPTNQAADVLLVRCTKQTGEPIEVHFVATDPSGRIVRTANEMPRGYLRFIANSQQQAGSYLLIPQPIAGQWSFQAYWANESIKANERTTAKLEVVSPRIQGVDSVSLLVEFAADRRFSESVLVDISAQ